MSDPRQVESGWVPALVRGRGRRLDSTLVFGAAVAMAALSLHTRSGWPNADAVEYLESASRVESGRPVPIDSVRPFFLSSLLVPLFRVARVLGSSEGREVIYVAAALMIVVSGLAAVATYRLGERLFGPGPGLCGALLLATNGVFIFWAPLAVADLPCAAMMAAATTAALAPPSPRRGLVVGALLGGAVLFKYQALFLGILLFSALPFLWHRAPSKLRLYGAVVSGVVVAILLQSSLDLLARRPFGATFYAYTRDNFVYLVIGRLSPVIRRVVGTETLESWVGRFGLSPHFEVAESFSDNARLTMPVDWYWTHRFHLLTWLELVFLAVGIVAAIRSRRHGSWLPAVVLAICAYALTFKGHKEFRLWLPAAPFLFATIGLGFAVSIDWLCARARRTASLIAAVALVQGPIAIVGGVPLQTFLERSPSLRHFLETDSFVYGVVRTPDGAHAAARRGWRPWQWIPEARNARDFSGYAKAAEWLNANAPRGARITAIWSWQLSMRLRPDLVLVVPRIQLDRFESGDVALTGELTALVDSVDYVVGHLTALDGNPSLFERLDSRFRTAVVMADSMYDESLDPIVVFERLKLGDAPDPWTRLLSPAEAAIAVARAPFDQRILFSTVDDWNEKPRPLVECLSLKLDSDEIRRGRLVAMILWRVPEGACAIEQAPRFSLSITNARDERCGARYEIGYAHVLPPRWAPGAVLSQRVLLRPPRQSFDFLETRRVNEATSLDAWLEVSRQTVDRSVVGQTFPRFLDTGRAAHRDFGAVHVGGFDFTR